MNFDLKNDSFTVILNNKNSNNSGEFITEFSKEIKLERDMEVALVEISLPNTTGTITEPMEIKLMIGLDNFDHPDWLPHERLIKTVIVEAGNYTSNEKFVRYIYELTYLDDDMMLREISRDPDLFFFIGDETPVNFDDDTSRYDYTFPRFRYDGEYLSNKAGYFEFPQASNFNKIMYWKMDEKLKRLLGFPEIDYLDDSKDWKYKRPKIFMKNEIQRADYRFDLFEKLSAIYIYSDIVKTSYIGDVKANVLRVICINKEDNLYIESFKNLIFIPLKMKNISSIGISIRDLMGDVIKFQNIENNNNIVTVTLLFRPLEQF